jgi:hypothetical protein
VPTALAPIFCMRGLGQATTGAELGMLCHEPRSALAPISDNPVLYHGALEEFTSATDSFV